MKTASWPSLHPAMEQRAASWPSADEAALQSELDGYLAETAAPGCAVRVFWKLGPRFLFAGVNGHFARDAGLAASLLLGTDDFDPRLPWAAQAAKYRADDQEVYDTGKAKLDILERQTSTSAAVMWVHVGKAPIQTAGGVIGVLGMYELIDDKTAQKLFFKRTKAGGPGSS
ncbi:MAG TPA: hypothetical protein VMT79_12235 [Candidatus Binatia bacterium]|nr:hypothetical protein [Candidatus Binatia bacterium]